jgi:GT2 family glycosyltransferase
MLLSIIIVNYNVKYYVEQCLNSVLASSIADDIEIIVLDNASDDGSLAYLTPRFPSVCFIDNKVNLGFSKANNIGISLARGKYILLLNPDTVIGEHVLENTCHFMETHPNAGALGVKMIDGFGQFLPESKRGFPTPWASFCKMTGLSKLFPASKLFSQYHLSFLDKNTTHKVDILAGAFMLLRKETITKTGMLDETFFMYGEDIDLSYRIQQSGYDNYYLPEKIIHYKGESTHKNNVHYIKIFYGAMLIFYKKHFPRYNRLYAIFIYIGIFVSGLFALLGKYISIAIGPIRKSVHPSKNILFNTKEQSYESIIDEIEKNKHSNTPFLLFNPDTHITIGTKTIIE